MIEVPPKLLVDEDVRAFPAAEVVETVRAAVRSHARGRLSAPPRVSVAMEEDGRWVFTVGAMLGGCQGFRAYGVGSGVDDQQLVAVWGDGRLQAVVVGAELGLRRTAGIGAVAADVLARHDARTMGLIGAGRQALAHVREVTAVRQLAHVRVFSPTPANREAAASWIAEQAGVPAEPVTRPEDAADGADLVTLATSSQQVVVDADAIGPGTHVTTLGPKFAGRHELPIAVTERAATIVADSLTQLEAYESTFFLDGHPQRRRLEELGVVMERGIDRGREDLTLFCSVGLAGTEPALAQAIARHSS